MSKNIEVERTSDWIKVKIGEVNLPSGVHIKGLEFSVSDLESLKLLKKKFENLISSLSNKLTY
tara:strand:- start:122 stop:310 length:189 start_codon:yes stop_codon:yes gene_type:complete